MAFDASYSGNPLVNAMALGLMETDDIVKSGVSGGAILSPMGSTTGRDGMGVSFASVELSAASRMIGLPYRWVIPSWKRG